MSSSLDPADLAELGRDRGATLIGQGRQGPPGDPRLLLADVVPGEAVTVDDDGNPASLPVVNEADLDGLTPPIIADGAPSAGTGVNGQRYIDRAQRRVWDPKSGGAWPAKFVSLSDGLPPTKYKAARALAARAGVLGSGRGGAPLHFLIEGNSVALGSSAEGPSYSRCFAGRFRARASVAAGYGGTGWIIPFPELTNTVSPAGNEPRLQYTGTWARDTGKGAMRDNMRGATSATLTFSPTDHSTGFEILSKAVSGDGTFTVTIDGGSPVAATVNCDNGGAEAIVKTALASPGGSARSKPHIMVITVTSGSVTILGLRTTNTPAGISQQTGVTVSKHGHSGYRVAHAITAVTAADSAGVFAAMLPDVVVGCWMTNEWGQTPQTAASFKADLGTRIDQVEAASGRYVILIPPTPANPANTPLSTWEEFRAAAYELAAEKDCGLIDIGRRWGTTSEAVAAGLMANETNIYHPTDAGQVEMGTAVMEYARPLFASSASNDHVARLTGGNTLRGPQEIQSTDTVATPTLTLTADNYDVVGGSGTAGNQFDADLVRFQSRAAARWASIKGRGEYHVDVASGLAGVNRPAIMAAPAIGSITTYNTVPLTGNVYPIELIQPSSDRIGVVVRQQSGGTQTKPMQLWSNAAGTATLLEVSGGGYLGIFTHTAPADADIAAGEVMLWFDQTNGASKLKLKGKSQNGTVVAGEVALA